MTKGKSTKIRSTHIRFGRRSYFFDVLQTENDKKYLKITESKFLGDGKDRQYNSFLLFPEDIQEFQKNFAEIAVLLI